jgi:hypothetical protein
VVLVAGGAPCAIGLGCLLLSVVLSVVGSILFTFLALFGISPIPRCAAAPSGPILVQAIDAGHTRITQQVNITGGAKCASMTTAAVLFKSINGSVVAETSMSLTGPPSGLADVVWGNACGPAPSGVEIRLLTLGSSVGGGTGIPQNAVPSCSDATAPPTLVPASEYFAATPQPSPS